MDQPTDNERRIIVAGGALLWVFGTLFLYYLAITPLTTYTSAKDWPQTPCRITSSTMTVSRNNDISLTEREREASITYCPEVKYTYEFNGKKYSSSTYTFTYTASGDKEFIQRIVDYFPTNSNATCWVNPDNPQEAVLNNLFPTNAVVAMVISLVMLYAGWWIIKCYSSKPSETSRT